MNAQPVIDLYDASEIPVDAGQSRHAFRAGSQICLRCNRGKMSPARRTIFDFLFSLAGLDRAICSSCGEGGVRLRVSRLVAFFSIATIVLGWIVAFAAKRETAPADNMAAAAPEVVVEQATLAPSKAGADDGAARSLMAFRKLSNRDIVNLTKSQVDNQYIVALIHRFGDGFEVDAKAKGELRKAGVSEEVILTMEDSTVAANVSAALARQTVVPAEVGYRNN